MARIGFVGLGNMGLPMARNLLKTGHALSGIDINDTAVENFGAAGGSIPGSVALVCAVAELIITMLPSGKEVREVYLGEDGVLGHPGSIPRGYGPMPIARSAPSMALRSCPPGTGVPGGGRSRASCPRSCRDRHPQSRR